MDTLIGSEHRVCVRVARIALLLGVTVPLMLCTSDLAFSQTKAHHYEVKTAFIFNFANFVQWPPEALQTDEFRVGIVSSDAIGDYLETTLSGKSVLNLPVVVKRITDPADLRNCHLLFLTGKDSRIRDILADLEGVPVLTVGESPKFNDLGGGIQFFIQDNKVRFGINLEAAQKSNLRVSSKLLRVAQMTGSAK